MFKLLRMLKSKSSRTSDRLEIALEAATETAAVERDVVTSAEVHENLRDFLTLSPEELSKKWGGQHRCIAVFSDPIDGGPEFFHGIDIRTGEKWK